MIISTAVCCVAMTSGCRSVKTPPPIVALPAASAPVIPLQLASYSRPTRIEVDFDDQRPDFERLYYPGTCEPRRWHDAMSVIPMESFTPSMEDELKQRVANSIKANDAITEKITLILTSFQFALDDREDIQSEYYAQYTNWEARNEDEDERRQERRNVASQTRMRDNKDSFGSKLMGEVMTAGFTTLFFDLPRSERRKEAAKIRTTAEPQTLPSDITNGKQYGLNCQIHATLVFTNHDGSQVEQSVRINNHAHLTDVHPLKEQTAGLIEEALEEFSASL